MELVISLHLPQGNMRSKWDNQKHFISCSELYKGEVSQSKVFVWSVKEDYVYDAIITLYLCCLNDC